ncbi:putative polyubiquitin binding protein [Eremomyces bilateralis CBS 781.70]|uniref:Polyubiquitin binding protein n=1 Tax=Eremomyces bilateralis CBS 781.70 TaxID=1392243 RepID=A0A6G1GE56_9PEZI|nr:putative polyubiquitin binding protein [Eremomyces bilateralis CBS 781.70]KAF1816186.1 putative polyubiquitin binding protein [Eremomyces bilateralis CBS 781.70]
MGEYKLSASLEGHEDDVRAVAFPDPSFVVSASRDATVRLWRSDGGSPPTYDGTVSSTGTSFVNSVAYAPPSTDFPDGLIVSGGKDTIIDVRSPKKTSHDSADALLLGHSGNVCALDVSDDGKTIVSGAWDAEARVWEVGKWGQSTVLKGHGGSVWAVLMYDRETIITGCADKLIRIFHIVGKQLSEIRGSPDVVRALCKLPDSHPSGAQFASAGNDAIIRLWTIQGKEVAQLHGHESFIYALATLPTGEIASSSEDRTVRIWKGAECVQTITHPAISVWSVSVCSQTGDIATGASDRIARVFTRDEQRHASPEAIAAFEESVKASAIPQQSLGEGQQINKEQLPGPEFLTNKSGTKDGQIQLIRDPNGSVSAHQWSVTTQEWLSVGTVVDAAGSSGRKVTYKGQDYDYVFDVDIEDGKPPLKLPFNLSQNPYDAARKFIEDNELPISYIDQTAQFIVTNTQGATLGQQQPAGGPDPWGSDRRYRPGDSSQSTAPAPAPEPKKLIPQKDYLLITTANLTLIKKKILEFNSAFSDPEMTLSPSELGSLDTLIETLAKCQLSPSNPPAIPAPGAEIPLRLAATWPPQNRLPVLDLLRILTAFSPATAQAAPAPSRTLIDFLADSSSPAAVFTPDAPTNNSMLAFRALANLFGTAAGRRLAAHAFESIEKVIRAFVDPSEEVDPASRAEIRVKMQNKNLTTAMATLLLNLAVELNHTQPESADADGDDSMTGGELEHESSRADRAVTLLDLLVRFVPAVKGTDVEGLYRGLVAVGTLLLDGGSDLIEAAKEVFDVEGVMESVVGKEQRINIVVKEIQGIVKGT